MASERTRQQITKLSYQWISIEIWSTYLIVGKAAAQLEDVTWFDIFLEIEHSS